MVEGLRLDSHLRQVRFVFDAVELGFCFVRSARLLTDPYTRNIVLAFAKHAHTTARSFRNVAPLTPDERNRIQRALDFLRGQIDACRKDHDRTKESRANPAVSFTR